MPFPSWHLTGHVLGWDACACLRPLPHTGLGCRQLIVLAFPVRAKLAAWGRQRGKKMAIKIFVTPARWRWGKEEKKWLAQGFFSPPKLAACSEMGYLGWMHVWSEDFMGRGLILLRRNDPR